MIVMNHEWYTNILYIQQKVKKNEMKKYYYGGSLFFMSFIDFSHLFYRFFYRHFHSTRFYFLD